jgi:hypothetical protein
VFELHPENATPNDVLLSQLGTFQYKRKYPMGEPAGGAQVPPGQQPPAQQPPSQPGIVGQVLDIDSGGGYKLRVTVRSVQEVQSLEGERGQFTARGKFVVVSVTSTNTGSNTYFTDRDDYKLQDDKGRRYPMADYDVLSVASDQFYRDAPILNPIDPGKSVEEVFVFDAARDAANYKLAPTQQ